jgi:hypothetical protein
MSQEPSYHKFQHSKKVLRNIRNAWSSKVFGGVVFDPVNSMQNYLNTEQIAPRENNCYEQICFSSIDLSKGGGFFAIKNVRVGIQTFQDIYILIEAGTNDYI